VETILVIVHPGSACGSADFNYNSKSIAGAERDGLIMEFDNWQEGVIVIDGDLSTELSDYPELNRAIINVLERAKQNGHISIRKRGDDQYVSNQEWAIKFLLKKFKLHKGVRFQVTGAWALGEDEGGGCVGSVCEAISSLGYTAEVSEMALTGEWDTE
jgi:hypothetical protein